MTYIHSRLSRCRPEFEFRLGLGTLMSEKSQAVYYIYSCHMLIDKALSSDKPNKPLFKLIDTSFQFISASLNNGKVF